MTGFGGDEPTSNDRETPEDDRTRDGDATADRAEPLGELAATVAERRGVDGADDGPRSTADPDFEELFDREDVAEIDDERLWERLEADDSSEALVLEAREVREIDKRQYCHGCEHFAEPPTVGCTCEGTEILELSSLETFRVADCPVVLEDERLEEGY